VHIQSKRAERLLSKESVWAKGSSVSSRADSKPPSTELSPGQRRKSLSEQAAGDLGLQSPIPAVSCWRHVLDFLEARAAAYFCTSKVLDAKKGFSAEVTVRLAGSGKNCGSRMQRHG
jgi:hypothetical protein